MRLEGKVAIVTGAGSGIGRAIALTLAREGADIVIADVDHEPAREVAGEVEALGRRAEAIKVDVSKHDEVNQMVEKALGSFKKIDILVNNAGITWMGPPEEESEFQWDTQIDINLKGQFLCCQAVGRHMIEQRGGKIVNIASISAHRGMFGLASYAASKGGVISLSRALAVNWAQYNINVNIVSPGFTLTPIVEKATESAGIDRDEFIRDRTKSIPFKRANRPEDIANAVLFLASSEADTVTGQEIIVDGGSCSLHPGCVPALEVQSA